MINKINKYSFVKLTTRLNNSTSNCQNNKEYKLINKLSGLINTASLNKVKYDPPPGCAARSKKKGEKRTRLVTWSF